MLSGHGAFGLGGRFFCFPDGTWVGYIEREIEPPHTHRRWHMRYSLQTLMLLTAVVPPTVAFVWFHWRLLLVALICSVLLAAWFWVSYSIARFFGNLVASLMG